MDLKKIKKVARQLLTTAGQLLIREYQRFDRTKIKLKSQHEILTKADLLSEEIIIAGLEKNFPGHGLVSEERGELKGQTEFCWYLDPLDGTTNFSMHHPLWSISLALAFRQEIIFGLIYLPILAEWYEAEAEQGAFLNKERIFVSSISSGKVLNLYCHGRELAEIKKAIKYYQQQKLAALDCRQLGSAAIELAYVASGRAESFVAPGAKVWDVAAGVLLVKEAGGKVTDFAGRPWQPSSSDIAASNGRVHGQILRVISKI